MERIWAVIGEIRLSLAFEQSGRVYDPDRERERLDRQIDQLTWQHGDHLSVCANSRLIEQVAQRNLAGIHAFAVGTLRWPAEDDAPVHALIGIEGELKAQVDGSRARLYMLETGPFAVPLAYEMVDPASPDGTGPTRT